MHAFHYFVFLNNHSVVLKKFRFKSEEYSQQMTLRIHWTHVFPHFRKGIDRHWKRSGIKNKQNQAHICLFIY